MEILGHKDLPLLDPHESFLGYACILTPWKHLGAIQEKCLSVRNKVGREMKTLQAQTDSHPYVP